MKVVELDFEFSNWLHSSHRNRRLHSWLPPWRCQGTLMWYSSPLVFSQFPAAKCAFIATTSHWSPSSLRKRDNLLPFPAATSGFPSQSLHDLLKLQNSTKPVTQLFSDLYPLWIHFIWYNMIHRYKLMTMFIPTRNVVQSTNHCNHYMPRQCRICSTCTRFLQGISNFVLPYFE